MRPDEEGIETSPPPFERNSSRCEKMRPDEEGIETQNSNRQHSFLRKSEKMRPDEEGIETLSTSSPFCKPATA